jgi:hypothetical protein
MEFRYSVRLWCRVLKSVIWLPRRSVLGDAAYSGCHFWAGQVEKRATVLRLFRTLFQRLRPEYGAFTYVPPLVSGSKWALLVLAH